MSSFANPSSTFPHNHFFLSCIEIRCNFKCLGILNAFWQCGHSNARSLLCVCACEVKSDRVLKHLLHSMQLNFFSVKCVSRWLLSPAGWAKLLLHLSQLNDFSALWSNACNRKSYGRANFLPHWLQLNGFSTVWVFTCFTKLPPSLNVLGHRLQWYGFSPVWIRSWIVKEDVFVKDLWHCEQKNLLSWQWTLICLD